ncbi:bifunctional metallophosphatase/5'-nucleotidase [Actinoallomurus rhizosphaericola]|uniref:bifunctional metallophosphatase/5'-nucleotidase n=1 Tax=Actinoallomurus rhizosphaericola TaxID=2952536 RepID=UPI002093353C|nr:bifunctional metallophosphatase/5'-nucleotidase [Actinoallomurus rhizosphaericola]MCO5997512.1 bifunctional metallophosphatase/5'-nucleotidase [Actinoallomurus rhizosphaericola]
MLPAFLRSRAARAGLIAVALGAVAAAPLAVTGSQPAGAVTIAGANTLSDKVAVDWAGKHRPARTTDVHLIAWNDFHGNLEPAGLTIYGRFAGGAAFLAKAVKDKQKQYGSREASVMAGDDIGASPLVNGLFNEEPATIMANMMNADFASVGNHEFDKGKTELLRIQNGGCASTGCKGAPYPVKRHGRWTTTNTYPGADFQYLSANVTDKATGKTLLPAYGVKRFPSTSGRPISVGFIGEVLQATPTIVTPTGVAGLDFGDEADAANRAAKQLARQGVKIPVLVIHQGGFQTGPISTPNGCAGNLAGSDIEAIAKKLDPSIKVIVSGHTHAEYRCTITVNGVTRLITSASSFGRILSDITLKVDNRTGTLVSADATNSIVENALNTPGAGVTRQEDPSKADPAVAKVVKQYVDASAPLANKVVGKIQGDLTRDASPVGETALGDVIADAQLAATSDASKGGAQVALMNPGGVRADLRAGDISSGGEAPGEVTYGEAFTVQPFGNSLVTKTMTGDMLRRVLEQQFTGCGGQTSQKILQLSKTLSYQSNPSAATCAGKIGEIKVNGATVTPTTSLRVTMNNFLATGGDGFTVFNEGTDPLGGAQDIDAFVAYLAAAGATGVAVPALDRITPLS